MFPQVAAGALIPRPSTETNASPRMMPGSSRRTATSKTPNVFGTRWRRKMWWRRAPRARAARTKSFCLSASIWLRTESCRRHPAEERKGEDDGEDASICTDEDEDDEHPG